MLKNGSKITIHFIDYCRHQSPTGIKTGITGMIFTVKTESGKLGFDGTLTEVHVLPMANYSRRFQLMRGASFSETKIPSSFTGLTA